MTEREAKNAGVKVILGGVMAGLMAAILPIVWIDGGLNNLANFFIDAWPNWSVALIGLFYSGYLLGKKAGTDIIMKKRNAYGVCLKTGFFTLFIGTLCGSLVGFGVDGLPAESFTDAVFDYIVKPFYWIFFFGLPFLLIISGILGWQIKRLGLENNTGNKK